MTSAWFRYVTERDRLDGQLAQRTITRHEHAAQLSVLRRRHSTR